MRQIIHKINNEKYVLLTIIAKEEDFIYVDEIVEKNEGFKQGFVEVTKLSNVLSGPIIAFNYLVPEHNAKICAIEIDKTVSYIE